jgi:Xaa-Pro aminopeptidase
VTVRSAAFLGIGLTTHEPPYMVEGEANPIEPGMCFSIEPGRERRIVA